LGDRNVRRESSRVRLYLVERGHVQFRRNARVAQKNINHAATSKNTLTRLDLPKATKDSGVDGQSGTGAEKVPGKAAGANPVSRSSTLTPEEEKRNILSWKTFDSEKFAESFANRIQASQEKFEAFLRSDSAAKAKKNDEMMAEMAE